MNASLVLSWWFPDQRRATVHDFATGGEMSVLCREIAAHMEIVDGGKAFYEGIIGDLEREVLALRMEKREVERQLEFWIGEKVGAMSV